MKPASPVNFNDQPIPNFAISCGVVAAMFAKFPKHQHIKLNKKTIVKE